MSNRRLATEAALAASRASGSRHAAATANTTAPNEMRRRRTDTQAGRRAAGTSTTLSSSTGDFRRPAAATAVSSQQQRFYVSAEQLTIVREKHFHLSKYAGAVEKFAGQEPVRKTVREQLEFGEQVRENPELLVQSAQYVQTEILVRLARTIRSFQNLPYIVGINPRIQSVYVKCWDWFVSLYEFMQDNGKVTSSEGEAAFTTHLLTVFQDHGNIMQYLRQGVAEVRDLPSSDSVDFAYVDGFLTRFILRRTSWRVLAENHLAYRSPKGSKFNGVYHLNCRPALIASDTFSKAQYLCETELAAAPGFAVKGDTKTSFAYIDAHLSYILLELIKNSMRATVSHHRKSGRHGEKIPKVVLRICDGEDITISLHDRGGGIPKDIAEDVWGYGFTTVEDTTHTNTNAYFPGMEHASLDLDTMVGTKQLAGWGFGLPLSKTYIEYLGGHIAVHNMPGYGCDTVLTLPKLSSPDYREQVDYA
eukprot:Rhum_TRINITY_DN15301_c14_g1::Rhum_TRINITY_DN15301_c14_g1_i1::g.150497::m.150497/K00905/BCKDK; [3-methyl-2-oxobutanoate dehydrogenase (acetyl-transferring)] kinase